jgi:hypothetical protein
MRGEQVRVKELRILRPARLKVGSESAGAPADRLDAGHLQ